MADGSLYTLTITEGSAGRAYAPQNGDTYVLTVYSNSIKKSSGTITVDAGNVLTLIPTKDTSTTFTITVGADNAITAMSGTITFDEGDTAPAPSHVAVPKNAIPSELLGTWDGGEEGSFTISAEAITMKHPSTNFSVTSGGTVMVFDINSSNTTYPSGYEIYGTVTEVTNGTTPKPAAVGDFGGETFLLNTAGTAFITSENNPNKSFAKVSPETKTYTGQAGGVSYTLTFTEASAKPTAYTPLVGDAYTLTLSGDIAQKSSGTVNAISDTTFTLKPASYPTITFSAKITGSTPQLLGLIHCTDSTPLAAGPDGIQTLVPMDIPEELWGVWDLNGGVYVFTPTVWATTMDTTSNEYGFIEGATFTPGGDPSDFDIEKGELPSNEYPDNLYSVIGGKMTKLNVSGTKFDEYIGMGFDPGVWYFNKDRTKYAVNNTEGKERTKRP